MKRRKYGNRIVTDRDGKTFHSKRELERWRELLLLQSAGKISALRRQVPIKLVGADGLIRYDNKRPASMVVDFAYVEGGDQRYEDLKGFENQLSKLKRAVLRAMGIVVQVTR